MTVKKNILILGKQPPPYMGTSVWFETLQQANWGTEWQVDFFNVNIHSSLDTLGKTRWSSIPKNLVLYQKLKRQLKSKKYQLVLIPISQETIGFVKDSFFIRIAAKRVDKVLLMLHGSNFRHWQEKSPSFVRNYTKSILKRTVGIIVLGEKLKSIFRGYYTPEKIFAIPNGANFIFPDKAEKKSKSFDILYLSNLQPSKGIEDVIDAIGILKEKVKHIQLTVVGQWRDEQTKARCLEKVEKQQLPILFIGPVYGNEKMKYFSQADVFVFPPRLPEGHPLVLVEAMAADLPIIATDQGAITESVQNGTNGFIVEPGKPEQIADKILLFIENPIERMEMGKQSLSSYQLKFTEKNMIDNFKKCFQKLLSEKLLKDEI